jgi:hypothetical protein
MQQKLTKHNLIKQKQKDKKPKKDKKRQQAA